MEETDTMALYPPTIQSTLDEQDNTQQESDNENEDDTLMSNDDDSMSCSSSIGYYSEEMEADNVYNTNTKYASSVSKHCALQSDPEKVLQFTSDSGNSPSKVNIQPIPTEPTYFTTTPYSESDTDKTGTFSDVNQLTESCGFYIFQAPHVQDVAPLHPKPPSEGNGSHRQGLYDDTWLCAQYAPAMLKWRTGNASSLMKNGPSTSDVDDLSNMIMYPVGSTDQYKSLNTARAAGGTIKASTPTRTFSKSQLTPLIMWASNRHHYQDARGYSLTVARNEVVGFHLCIRSNRDFLVITDSANWFAAQGHIPRARVAIDESLLSPHLKLETFLVKGVEMDDGFSMMEFLDPSGTSSLTEPMREHVLYVRIRIGASVAENLYEIPLWIFTQAQGFQDEQITWSSTIRLNVCNVTLSNPSQYKFHLDLWQHFSSLARAHQTPLWSDAHFEVMSRYLSELSQLGQKCVSVVATEMPWAGQQCYLETKYPSALYEHAILQVYEETRPSYSEADIEHTQSSKESVSQICIDFSHFDRLLALSEQYHIDTIEVFGLFAIWQDTAHGFTGPVIDQMCEKPDAPPSSPTRSRISCTEMDASLTHSRVDTLEIDVEPRLAPLDGWRIRCFTKKTQSFRYLRDLRDIERFITLFYEHCVELSIIENVRICADEPSNVELFLAQMEFIQRLAPKFKYKVAINHFDFFHVAPPQVVDYVPILPLACRDMEITRQTLEGIRAKGGKLCWYVCCGPSYPNQFVSSPLVEGELIGYLTYFLNLDGFLRWNYCLWPNNPWHKLCWRSPTWKVGDMYFVLPGRDGRPIETLRFESLRFAVQAYELLVMAEELLLASCMEQLKQQVAELVFRTENFSDFCRLHERRPEELYSLDPMDYQRAKTLLLETIANAKRRNPAVLRCTEQTNDTCVYSGGRSDRVVSPVNRLAALEHEIARDVYDSDQLLKGFK
ncbi:unnamed protein product [Albugo candida]|uniref:Glycoside hydrolase 123 catalytic domain-containing protein n=1 Tax=Albugo candida TaxID=65357 RepID=A0A024GGR3_9STRA|nr:unnamed protein product [Albugo candida]|eukprot:CCI46077.1 unnamed protein product [Albugo candida]